MTRTAEELEQNLTDHHNKPEPFGYFKADPFGWTDCAETEEGAQPLYDQASINDLLLELDAVTKQRDQLVETLEKLRNMIILNPFDACIFIDELLSRTKNHSGDATKMVTSDDQSCP